MPWVKMFIGLSTWIFIWSQMAANSSFFVLITFPSLFLIFQDEEPSLLNLRVITMVFPYSSGL